LLLLLDHQNDFFPPQKKIFNPKDTRMLKTFTL